jgi:hypothetical protein
VKCAVGKRHRRRLSPHLRCSDPLYGGHTSEFLPMRTAARFALRRALRTSAPRVASVHTWAPAATCPVTRAAVSAVPTTVLPALPFRCVRPALSLSHLPTRSNAPHASANPTLSQPQPFTPAEAARKSRSQLPGSLHPEAKPTRNMRRQAITPDYRAPHPPLTPRSSMEPSLRPWQLMPARGRDLCTCGVESLQDKLTDPCHRVLPCIGLSLASPGLRSPAVAPRRPAVSQL